MKKNSASAVGTLIFLAYLQNLNTVPVSLNWEKEDG